MRLPQTSNQATQNRGGTVFRSFGIAVVFVGAASASACAQSSQNPGSVMISAKVGGKSYESAGQGSCRHTPTASIYGVPAALWMVALTGPGDAAGEKRQPDALEAKERQPSAVFPEPRRWIRCTPDRCGRTWGAGREWESDRSPSWRGRTDRNFGQGRLGQDARAGRTLPGVFRG